MFSIQQMSHNVMNEPKPALNMTKGGTNINCAIATNW